MTPTTLKLADALKQWRIARSADDELRWYVAGQMMADAIDRFLQETNVVGGDRDDDGLAQERA